MTTNVDDESPLLFNSSNDYENEMVDLEITDNSNRTNNNNNNSTDISNNRDSNNNNNNNKNNRNLKGNGQMEDLNQYSFQKIKDDCSRVLIVSEERDILHSYPFYEFLELTKYFKKKSVTIDKSNSSVLSPAISHLFEDKDSDGDSDNEKTESTIEHTSDDFKDDQQPRVKKKSTDFNEKQYISSEGVDKTPLIGRKKQFKPLWIDLGGIKDYEILQLGKQLNIHPLTIEDILSNETSEKCEEYPEYLFVSTSELQYSTNGDLREVRFYMILYQDFILVFHNKELISFDYVLRSFRYLTQSRVPSSDWILCSYFEAINDTLTHYSEQLLKEVQTLDDFTLNEDSIEYKELYVRIGRASRRSTNLFSNLFIKVDILSSLLRQNINKESIRYLSNIKDRCLRLTQNLKLIEQLLENVQNTYISKVSLLLNEESHTLNISMRKFAIITLLFLPLNFIASAFGMNIRVPGMIDFLKDEEGGQEFFYIILTSMVVIGVLFALFMKKIGWLD